MGANTGSPIDDILSDLGDQPGYQGNDDSRNPRRDRDRDDNNDSDEDEDVQDDDNEVDDGIDESPDGELNEAPESPAQPEAGNPAEAGEAAGNSGLGGGVAEGGSMAGESGIAAGGAAEGAAAGAEGAAAAAESAAAAAETAAVAAEAAAATTEAAAAGTAAAVEAAPVVGIVLGIVALVLLLLLVIFPAMGGLFGGGDEAVANPTSEISGDVQDMAQQILTDKNITVEGNPRSSLQAAADGKCSPIPQTGGCVMLDARLLEALLTVAQKRPLVITSLTTGDHSTCSNHYQGRAVDLGSTDRSILDEFRKEGATELLGPGDEGHDDHLHVGWDGPNKNCE